MSPGSLKILLLFTVFLLTFSSIKAEPIPGFKVEIQILDKITSKVKTVNIDVNKKLIFESLIIEIYACFKNPPEYIPEDFVLLKIYDEQIALENDLIYQGWMISSSPSTTPLEHPIYDLWLKDCKVSIEF
mgnify:FL=1|tara:strand:- start:161 stop:550 length:390 start_codon:yes stop_codon:yes gene_type:complete